MAQVTPLRSEIPVQHTWDTDSIFASVADWEAAIGQLGEQLEELSRYHGRLAESPSVLAEFITKLETMQKNMGKISVYASLNYSVDTNNQEWAARSDRARGLSSRSAAAVAFAEPELLQIGFATLRQWLAADERLTAYGHYLDRLEMRQAHVRSAEVEQVLGQVQDPLGTANSTHSVLANADLKFAPATDSNGESYDITQGSIGSLTTHADREVRRTAWENYADAHLTFKNTMANALAGGVKRDVFFARVRRYEGSLDAALSNTFIPTAVFHNLINTFKANLPTWHRYWAIRRQDTDDVNNVSYYQEQDGGKFFVLEINGRWDYG
ncbi:MAG: oligoendopeptidase F family protein, partial [Anaerolineae bacterium]|nr:oligoendopeptidase F family protein [Anaerolineae bacterium]